MTNDILGEATQHKSISLITSLLKTEEIVLFACCLWSITYLHDLQQYLSDRLQGWQSKGLSLVGAWRKRTIPVAGTKGDDRSRFDLADAEEQVKLWQGELCQT